MFKDEKDRLFLLVKSLTKAEKRNFKLFANRIKHKDKMKFVALFEVLDRLSSYSETKVLNNIKGVESTQLQNVKRHLYKQLLKSLRLIYHSKEIEIQIREELDYANILYGKGLFLNSLRILDRVKKLAVSHHQQLLLMEILEFEKRIEGRHITRSRKVKQRMEILIKDAQNLTELNNRIATLSNLALKIHGYFIKNGHVKNVNEKTSVTNLFRSEIRKYKKVELTPPELVSWHQSKVWFYYILMDFNKCKIQAIYWVEIFEKNPNMIKSDVPLYLRGLHYSMNMYYYLGQYENYQSCLKRMELFHSNNSTHLNFTDGMMYFIYHSNGLLNNYLLNGNFVEGVKLKVKILNEIKIYSVYLDKHRTSVLKYKLAWMHFGLNELDNAMGFINEIINEGGARLRQDVLYYAKVIQLLIHIEWGNKYLLESLIISIKRMTDKLVSTTALHKEVLIYIEVLIKTENTEKKIELATQLKDWMVKWFENKFERRVLAYFDYYSWIDSHINNTTIEHEVRLRHTNNKAIMLL